MMKSDTNLLLAITRVILGLNHQGTRKAEGTILPLDILRVVSERIRVRRSSLQDSLKVTQRTVLPKVAE
jgi:hypothetical protein